MPSHLPTGEFWPDEEAQDDATPRVRFVLEIGRLKRQVNVRWGEMKIGRDRRTCRIVFQRLDISREHCAVTWSEQGLFVRDLRSRNGTYVNGKRIQRRTSLKPGDSLTIVGIRIEVRELSPTGQPPSRPSALADQQETDDGSSDSLPLLDELDEENETGSETLSTAPHDDSRHRGCSGWEADRSSSGGDAPLAMQREQPRCRDDDWSDLFEDDDDLFPLAAPEEEAGEPDEEEGQDRLSPDLLDRLFED